LRIIISDLSKIEFFQRTDVKFILSKKFVKIKRTIRRIPDKQLSFFRSVWIFLRLFNAPKIKKKTN